MSPYAKVKYPEGTLDSEKIVCAHLTPEQENYIYHAELFIGDQRIMMSDNMDVNLVKSTALSLTVTFDTKGEVKQAYEVLQEDSETVYQMQSTTYSSCMVVIIDKFGFRWVLMVV